MLYTYLSLNYIYGNFQCFSRNIVFITVANPSFSLVKIFDFAVASLDEMDIAEGLPIIGAVLLQGDKQY